MKIYTLLLVLSVPLLGIAQSMHLDSTFHSDGIGLYGAGVSDWLNDAVLQDDGKIILSGHTLSLGNPGLKLLRLNSNGFADESFGDGGVVIGSCNNSPNGSGERVLVQPDGKIISVGIHYVDLQRDIAIFRFNSDGSADETFAPDGKLILDLGFDETARDLIVQPDGKILIFAGLAEEESGSSIVVRILPTGVLDASFGIDGYIYLEDIMEYQNAHAFILQPDGKFLIGGSTGAYPDDINDRDLRIFRFNSDGTADMEFGESGETIIDFFPDQENLSSMYLSADGSIFVAASECGDAYTMIIHKLNPYGGIDADFGEGGVAVKYLVDFPYILKVIAGDGLGRLYVGGINNGASDYDFAVIRLNPDGTQDPEFSPEGIILINIDGLSIDNPAKILLQEDGNVILAGTSTLTNGRFAAIRLSDDFITPTAVSSGKSHDDMLQFYPNPADDHVIIQDDRVNNALVLVFDVFGRNVLSYTNVDDNESLSVAQLSLGCYIVEVRCGDKIYNSMLIKR